MAWIETLSEWATTMFEQVGYRPAALLFAFILGLVSAVASACCTLPVLGAIVGYSGTQTRSGNRSKLLGVLFFMFGSIIALVVLGSVAGFIGQVAQGVLGRYWKLFAGFVAIFVGLGALNLLPFKLSRKGGLENKSRRDGLVGAAVFGFVMGGGVSVASLGCNPGIYIVLGVAVLQGYTLWAMAILAAYAVGFSLPLAAIMFGVSLGSSAVKARKAEFAIRVAGGVCLIVAGFYFLAKL